MEGINDMDTLDILRGSLVLPRCPSVVRFGPSEAQTFVRLYVVDCAVILVAKFSQ